MVRITVSSVIERDIDFLLIEEFAAPDGFLPWFLEQISLPTDYELEAVAHSVTANTGETDIELTLSAAGNRAMILIENKIAAVLQPRQAERYRERADRYLEQGACTTCITVIIAPDAYFGAGPTPLDFDHRITYEQILSWFAAAENLATRRPAKITLLERALTRGHAGWKLVPDEPATAFWRHYWDLCRGIAPELHMAQPDAKPATSGFVHFRPAGFPKNARLIHKAPYGVVDIQLAGKAADLAELAAALGPWLEPGMVLQSAGKSAVVRLSVPPIDIRAPFAEVESAVREGIWAAKLLNLWAKRAEDILREALSRPAAAVAP